MFHYSWHKREPRTFVNGSKSDRIIRYFGWGRRAFIRQKKGKGNASQWGRTPKTPVGWVPERGREVIPEGAEPRRRIKEEHQIRADALPSKDGRMEEMKNKMTHIFSHNFKQLIKFIYILIKFFYIFSNLWDHIENRKRPKGYIVRQLTLLIYKLAGQLKQI